MKMRHLSFVSLAAGCAFLTTATAFMGGCGGGGGGGGGGGTTVLPENRISDFEDLAAAVVTQDGAPARNGYWYTYNDDNPKGMSATCVQVPPSGPQLLPDPPATYVGTAPPSAAPGTTGSLALHAVWSGCNIWGAGIGADLNQPPQPDGGTYTGKKVAYPVGGFTGVTFWAMATPDSDTGLRIKFPMTDETKVEDGGDCIESTVAPINKCSDDWGAQFILPSTGAWKQFTIKFSDVGFKQEGWGTIFPWNPAHVTSIQIQSTHMGEPYDFWIDDMYFIQ